ncbi:hypothetical protein MRX96_006731 [Rhipicephalus microplus]
MRACGKHPITQRPCALSTGAAAGRRRRHQGVASVEVPGWPNRHVRLLVRPHLAAAASHHAGDRAALATRFGAPASGAAPQYARLASGSRHRRHAATVSKMPSHCSACRTRGASRARVRPVCCAQILEARHEGRRTVQERGDGGGPGHHRDRRPLRRPECVYALLPAATHGCRDRTAFSENRSVFGLAKSLTQSGGPCSAGDLTRQPHFCLFLFSKPTFGRNPIGQSKGQK